MVNVARLAAGVVALSLVLGGCTNGSTDPPSESPSASAKAKAPTLESVAQDLLPGLATAPMAETNLPQQIDIPKQRPPSLLQGPAVAAKLGMVSIDDGFEAEGFAGQYVYFLGNDDQWRVLNMAELGLPPSDWTGPDGSGMGDLSPDGTQWSFVTNRHVVVLDLLTKKLQFLSLPNGDKPQSSGWTVRSTLIAYSLDRPDASSYELDPKTDSATTIRANAGKLTVLADGSRAIAGLQNGEIVGEKNDHPFVRFTTATGEPVARKDFSFSWPHTVGLYVQRAVDGDVGVFLDSLGLVDSPPEGSMVAVVDQSLRLKATLPWPKRTNGDNPIGWIDDDTFLLTYGETLAAWCPGQSKLSRVSAVSNDLAVSMAMEVVDATCV